MVKNADVVVVGGGIAGASLAYALATEGVSVTVLEATLTYTDRVRGESMHAWGVREARALGVESLLLEAGAHVAPLWKRYIEGIGEAGEIPMMTMVPGVEGSLNLGHPEACQALVDAAAAAGATIVRGVRGLRLGEPGTLSYAADGRDHQVRAGLVVGADGRGSTVRSQAGINLWRQEASGYVAGLLVEGLDDVPADHDVVIDEGDRFHLLFHQGAGRARAYVACGLGERRRFAGREATRRFLDAWHLSWYPWGDRVAASVPVGPCAAYPGDDTWTDRPFAPGVVLIGDAAGHNDPIIGQGLSLAMRDARVVRDLVLGGARRGEDFEPYGIERHELLGRLRFAADLIAVTQVEDAGNRTSRRMAFGHKMAAMDPAVVAVVTGSFKGPETIPPDRIDPGLLEEIRNA